MRLLTLNEVRWLDGSIAVVVDGIVDDDTVEDFEKTLDSAVATEARMVIIDLTAGQLASAGLAALIRLQRRSGRRPAPTPLVVTDVELLGIFEIVGITSRFRIYTTLDAALRGGPADQVAGSRAFAVAPVARPTRRKGRVSEGRVAGRDPRPVTEVGNG